MNGSETMKLNKSESGVDSKSAVANSPEKPKTYRELGAERRKATKENLKKKIASLGGWMDKIKGFFKDKAESAVDHAFALPEMAKDGMKSASEYANKKIEATQKWSKDKKDAAEAYAKMGAHLAVGAGEKVAGKFEDAARDAKEKVKNGYNSLIESGKASIDKAKGKIASVAEKFRTWRANRLIENAKREENEAKRKLVEAMQKKRALMAQLFGNQAAA